MNDCYFCPDFTKGRQAGREYQDQARMTKKNIAYGFFLIALFYLISPFFFEKILLLNELLAAGGLGILIYRRGLIGYDTISLCMAGLIGWGLLHAVSSLLRMDSLYYYLRNSVILYSMFIYFIGFYCLAEWRKFIDGIRNWLRVYLGWILFYPNIAILYERFGLSTLFPTMIRKPSARWVPWFIIGINFIYGITYSSLTAWIVAVFFILLFTVPGYRFFKQCMVVFFSLITLVFIYIIPNLGLIKYRYNYYNWDGYSDVAKSMWFLRIDPNTTWRLILWRQVIVDKFPGNLAGIGFGTPMFKYLAIADYSKLETLPYVLGAHNGYLYLFGRLGLPYVFFTLVMYRTIFREYFYFKAYYYATREILLFWSFFSISILCSFNPSLESPIYAGAYWLMLGLTARVIYNRRYPVVHLSAA